jgi:hypothetical protein
MAMLAAYLDDSGTHGGSPLAVVGGAVGTLAEWIKFSKLWKRELRRHNLEFFRMADFVSGYGAYRGWGDSKKRNLLSALVSLIKRHSRLLIGNAVFPSDFAAAYAQHPTPCIKDAYHFCAVMTLPMIGYWEVRSGPVALIFESGNKLLDEYFRLVQKDFSNDVARDAYGIGSITLGNKRDMPPLQAADIVAYGAWKCATQKTLQPYLAEAYGSLWRMRNSQRVWDQEWIGKALAVTVDDLGSRSHLYRGMFKTHANAKGKGAQ